MIQKRFIYSGLSLWLLFSGAAPVAAQTALVPRNNYGALLEPQNVLMHGAGQSPQDFHDYWRAMPPDYKPNVYMHYIGLNNLQPSWADDLKATLLSYPDHFIIPQIGLSMTADGSPESRYEHRVANGEFDQQIDYLIEGFRRLAYPAYLRIGYEFNGLVWNGYLPESYKAAFIRITDKLREANLEVATVWCGAMDGERNVFDYYPGDPYVDWFGLDLFSAEHFSDPWAYAFLDSAHVRHKPVMIGETTPRYVGVTDGAADWEQWFVPFFDYMHSRPEIKQFGYINWNWPYWSAQFGINWFDWGDARLQTNAEVLSRYTTTISQSSYQHASSETLFRQSLGYEDSVPPPTVTNLARSPESTHAELTWDPVTDASGLSRYIIYKDGEVADYTLLPSYRVGLLGEASYHVIAMDRAGNESAPSNSISVNVLRQERIANGDFEQNLKGWQLDLFAPLIRATLSPETSAPLVGAASAHVNIQRTSNTDWHIQLRQFMRLTAGNTYLISFKARANGAVTVPLMFQQTVDPFSIYHQHDLNVTSETQSFAFSITPTVSDAVAFSFFLGAIGRTEFWVDAVSVVEIDPSLVFKDTPPSSSQLALSVFANPATAQTTISYTLPEATQVRLEAFDLLGRRIRVLHDGWQPSGEHVVPMALPGVVRGPYVLRLSTTSGHTATLPFTLLD